MTRAIRTAIGLAAAAAGVALLVWYLREVGLDQVRAGLVATGAGFFLILALAGPRFVLRAAAWTMLLERPASLGHATRATLAGDAIGTLTPLGLVASEPAKALALSPAVPVGRGLAALMAENFFYSVSIAIYIMLGAAVMIAAFDLPAGLRLSGALSLVAMAAGLGVAALLAWQQPAILSGLLARLPVARLRATVERVRAFEFESYGAAGRQGVRLGRLVACETAFHVLSFLEAWYTLYLVTGQSAPLEAFVLDAFGRFSNVAFRLVPLRLGVDQAGSGLVAVAIGLDAATGVTVSIVRTARVIVWSIVGLGALLRVK